MSEGPDISNLVAGATGHEAQADPNVELAERRRQQRTRPWADATPMLRDSAAAYRQVMGTREERARQPAQPGRSTFSR